MHDYTTAFVRSELDYRTDRIRTGINGRRRGGRRTSTPRLGHGDPTNQR